MITKTHVHVILINYCSLWYRERYFLLKESPRTGSSNILQSLRAIKLPNSIPSPHKYSRNLKFGTLQGPMNHSP